MARPAGRGAAAPAEAGPGSDPLTVRRRVLDAAATLLRHRGYEATTTRAIAERAGIKAGSIYHHYPSKDAIVAAVVNEGVRVVREAVEAALRALPPDASPRDRLEAIARAHLASSLENSNYTSASIRAFAFLPDGVRDDCRAERRRYEAIWAGVVEAAGETGLIRPGLSLDVVRLMLLGAVNWAGEWYRPGRVGVERIAHDLAELILGPRPAPAPSRERR